MIGFFASGGMKKAAIAAAVLGFAATTANAQRCGLCAETVTVNSGLASCFLEEYTTLAASKSEAIAVDLSDCSSRGVVEAIPGPQSAAASMQPDTRFLLSRDQLQCLKAKLEEPGLALDPSLTIALDKC